MLDWNDWDLRSPTFSPTMWRIQIKGWGSLLSNSSLPFVCYSWFLGTKLQSSVLCDQHKVSVLCNLAYLNWMVKAKESCTDYVNFYSLYTAPNCTNAWNIPFLPHHTTLVFLLTLPTNCNLNNSDEYLNGQFLLVIHSWFFKCPVMNLLP
jgi:hypothetical protein